MKALCLRCAHTGVAVVQPTPKTSPAFSYTLAASLVDSGETDDVAQLGGGWQPGGKSPLSSSPDRNRRPWSSGTRRTPTPTLSAHQPGVNECSSDIIQGTAGSLPVQNSSYCRRTQSCCPSQEKKKRSSCSVFVF